jgi:hypothetical protein
VRRATMLATSAGFTRNVLPSLVDIHAQGISTNAQDTMPLLLADAAKGAIDVVVHIGDAAYDLDSNGGATGDSFMVQIEPLAAHLPYMICPGTVERASLSCRLCVL